MTFGLTMDCSIYIAGYTLTRAEGRTDDPAWPVGECRVYGAQTLDGPPDIKLMDGDLRRVTWWIEHAGCDKFDLEVIYSDGSRCTLRLDVDRDFTRLYDVYPSLNR